MIRLLSNEDMRRSDGAAVKGGTPGRELMLRAAAAIAGEAQKRPPVAFVCGSGNNAGDGYAAALILKSRGVACSVFTLGGNFSADGRYYADRCVEEGLRLNEWDGSPFEGFGTVVDCIFGSGLRGAPEGIYADAVNAVNASGSYVISADINSGLNGDSGLSDLCVRSDLTVAVGYYRPGHFLGMAKDVMKSRICADIGIGAIGEPMLLFTDADARNMIPRRDNCSHKGTYGYTALIGGSLMYSGAIRLAAMAGAAMRSGAGVVKVAAPRSLCPLLVPHVLESTLFPLSDDGGSAVFSGSEMRTLISGVRTAAFGMGIGVSEQTGKMLKFLLDEFRGTLIIDADGLNLLSAAGPDILDRTGARVILTPHAAEFSRLCGRTVDEVLASPVSLARSFASRHGCVVLLKGPATVVTNGTATYITDAGCPGMATAGSGDVLSGIASAVCSYLDGGITGAVLSAYINGKAGELAQASVGAVSMVASDTVAHIPEVIRALS